MTDEELERRDLGTDDLWSLFADELAVMRVAVAEVAVEQDNDPVAYLRLLRSAYRDIYRETITVTGIHPKARPLERTASL